MINTIEWMVNTSEDLTQSAFAFAWASSDCMSLEAPIIALRLLQHLPKCALPLTSFLVLLLDPKSHLHHAARDVPITPQRLHRLIVISWTRRLVEERPPGIFIFAHKLDLLKRILGL